MTDTPTPQAGTPRTLPSGPIPLVAYDQIIEEGWGDSVAQSLNNVNESEQWLTYPDESGTTINIDAPTSSTLTTWLEPGQVFVPDWAALTIVHTEIDAISEGSGGPNTYDLQLSIGGITSGHVLRLTAPVASGGSFSAWWACRIDLSSLTGLQDVEILARRVAGSGVWNFGSSTVSAVGVFPRYVGAINWYGD